jgi:predicted nuclease of restriction endonuclease-like (RecB) superfamily
MNFEQLIKSFEQAHKYLQEHAVSTVNQSLTIRNWVFGHYIVEYEQNGEDRARYGTELMKNIADTLSIKNIKGLSDRSLRNCRQFYLVYPNIDQVLSELALPESIWQSATAKSHKDLINKGFNGVNPKLLLSTLSFTHIIELTREEDLLKRSFYETQAIQGNWSVKELQRQMGSLLFERTGLSSNKEGLMLDVNKKAEQLTIEGIMRDPYVFEFVGLESAKKLTESKLEAALIDHLQVFLLELGKGFCFEARQKRLWIDGEYFNIDLVFYHRILKCHILIDLKTRTFKPADAGQMNFYLNYFKDNEMYEADNPPVGIVLCANKKKSTVKYATGSLENLLFVRRYQVQLPTEKELEEFIKKDIKLLENLS